MNPNPDGTSKAEIEITVAVTCYNEAEFIEETLNHITAALRESGRTHEVIVIEDVSSDNSAQVVREYIDKHHDAPIKLVVNKQNRGLANNYVEAAFLGRGTYYRLCCGDNSEPKESFCKLLKQIGKADMIIPYQNTDDSPARNLQRRILSKTFTFLVNHISGYRINYYNGLAIHLRYNIMRWHPSSYGFGFQADIITRLLDEGESYIQVATTSIERKGSASTAISIRNVLSVGHTLLELAIRRLRRILYGKKTPKPAEIIFEHKK